MNHFSVALRRHWNQKKGIEVEPAIPDHMILSKTTLPNGATFTRLKPMAADGCETAELWKDYKL